MLITYSTETLNGALIANENNLLKFYFWNFIFGYVRNEWN